MFLQLSGVQIRLLCRKGILRRQKMRFLYQGEKRHLRQTREQKQ